MRLLLMLALLLLTGCGDKVVWVDDCGHVWKSINCPKKYDADAIIILENEDSSKWGAHQPEPKT